MNKFIFLIGAAKSGTTLLATILNKHPEICLSSPKETNFFTNKCYKPNSHKTYLKAFHKKECKYLLDASTSYSAGWNQSSKNIAERIARHYPQAIIIYIFRNPVKRAWSSYWHARRVGSEVRTPDEAFKDFNSSHIQASLYYDRLQDYLTYFKREQITLISFEDFIQDPEKHTNQILKKIKLDKINISKSELTKKVNKSYRWRKKTSYLNKIPIKYLKSINKYLTLFLPVFIHQLIKNIVSKEIPRIDPINKDYLESQLLDKYEMFLTELSNG
ncbi:sulfotransferase [Thalassotalea nanhaiensis]|uniref:Sulfotransferase n=1 Tax=Thalassotalea nanhaiensis TaxID=3065648 RepID=A0ABY9TI64_9GAMM|nr:sulfotransferase [Colwelliaceae bacterium SQ345]